MGHAIYVIEKFKFCQFVGNAGSLLPGAALYLIIFVLDVKKDFQTKMSGRNMPSIIRGIKW
jgi:hypothetical protein